MTESAHARRVSHTDGVVLLRPWIASDAEFMFTASQDPEIQRFNGPSPRSIEDAAAAIADITRAWLMFHDGGAPTGAAFAICDAATGQAVGMCGIDSWSPIGAAQFGYWLAAHARGRGFATRAVALMTTWLFETGASQVFVTIRQDNDASAAVVRRAGFLHAGSQAGPNGDTLGVYSSPIDGAALQASRQELLP